LPDRLRNPEHVREEDEHVIVGQQMMLVGALLEQQVDHVGLARALERLASDRHPTVRDDDHHVAGQAEEHEPYPRQSQVRGGERDQERVRDGEDRRPNEQVRSVLTLGKRNELDRQTHDDESPPTQA
jgi:hypothetical protein